MSTVSTQKSYYGIASIICAVAALFVATPALSIAAITLGIVGIATARKNPDRKQRGESILGLVFGALILAGTVFIALV